MTNLEIGQKAPAFKLPSSEGGTFSLKDAEGKWLVLYFYPKDDTPGCTKEACNFRDRTFEYKTVNAVIYGVSVDSLDSHAKFIKKFQLNFPLLSDSEKSVVEAYGVWKEKNMYGKKYWGVERTTLVIDPKGKIAKIFPKVKVDNHHQEVLDFILANKE